VTSQPPSPPAGEETDHLREQRLEKLERVRQSGANPWPARFERSHTTAQASEAFAANEERLDARLAGRLTALRDLGGMSFSRIQDGAGKLQLSFHKEDLGERYEALKDLDIGDFAGVSGWLWRTRRGEITLRVQEFELLAKSLRPLPEKWHGLQDPEKRYRQRYLDLISNDEVRAVFEKRTRIVRSLRRFLDERDFLEVETPALQPLYGGAAARPFVTHHNALDRDLFLRISDELYLKRLIIGGFDKVYEIAKDFRNEGIDTRHNPEFTMMELYEAYTDLAGVMALTEELLRTLALDVTEDGSVQYGDHMLNYAEPFRSVTVRDALRKWAGIDALEASDEDLAAAAKMPLAAGRGKLLDELLSEHVEPKLIQPTFLTDWPVELSPLAKRRSDEPRLVERFELFVAGIELANAFSELNDPLDQRERLQLLAKRRAEGDEEAAPIDEDFLEAMEYGMPPTGGLGMGIDRLTMLLTGQTSIREVILFPQMRTLS
jgi:lysyl-tRNA synthetase, class II